MVLSNGRLIFQFFFIVVGVGDLIFVFHRVIILSFYPFSKGVLGSEENMNK